MQHGAICCAERRAKNVIFGGLFTQNQRAPPICFHNEVSQGAGPSLSPCVRPECHPCVVEAPGRHTQRTGANGSPRACRPAVSTGTPRPAASSTTPSRLSFLGRAASLRSGAYTAALRILATSPASAPHCCKPFPFLSKRCGQMRVRKGRGRGADATAPAPAIDTCKRASTACTLCVWGAPGWRKGGTEMTFPCCSAKGGAGTHASALP